MYSYTHTIGKIYTRIAHSACLLHTKKGKFTCKVLPLSASSPQHSHRAVTQSLQAGGEGMPGAHSPATWQRAPQASGRTSWDTGPADSPQRPPAGGHQTATCVPEMPPTRPTSDLEPSLKVCIHLTKSKRGEPLPLQLGSRERSDTSVPECGANCLPAPHSPAAHDLNQPQHRVQPEKASSQPTSLPVSTEKDQRERTASRPPRVS